MTRLTSRRSGSRNHQDRSRSFLYGPWFRAGNSKEQQMMDVVKMPNLTAYQQTMLAAWQQHTYAEFGLKDPDAALAVMTEDPYVLCVPSGTGGVGRAGVHQFYANQMLPNLPPDLELVSLSRIFGDDRIVEEFVIRFTH